MSHLDRMELMHAVLDGEATAQETHELEQLVATDPVARAEFEGFTRLFAALGELPLDL